MDQLWGTVLRVNATGKLSRFLPFSTKLRGDQHVTKVYNVVNFQEIGFCCLCQPPECIPSSQLINPSVNQAECNDFKQFLKLLYVSTLKITKKRVFFFNFYGFSLKIPYSFYAKKFVLRFRDWFEFHAKTNWRSATFAGNNLKVISYYRKTLRSQIRILFCDNEWIIVLARTVFL